MSAIPRVFAKRPFPSAIKGETLIIIATFHRTEGIQDVAAHNEIRRAIQQIISERHLEGIRVEIEPRAIKASNRDQARQIGNQHYASLIIWGADTGVRLEVNLLSLRESPSDATEFTIWETERTQLANPSAYAHFVVRDLPGWLAYLSFFALGHIEYAHGNYERAIIMIKTALAALPVEAYVNLSQQILAETYFRLGWLYQVTDQLPLAIANYDKAIDLTPEAAVAFNNRGFAYHTQGKFVQAIADFNRAIDLDSTYASAFNNRGLAYEAQGEVALAIADYDEAIRLDHKFASAFNNRGATYSEQGNYTQAIADFDEAIKLDPSYAAPLHNRALAHHNQANLEQAAADYRRYLELSPQTPEQEAIRQLIRTIEEFIASDPSNTAPILARAAHYIKKGEHELALADFEQVIDLNPADPRGYMGRGAVYGLLGEVELALLNYRQALDLDLSSDERATIEQVISELEAQLEN